MVEPLSRKDKLIGIGLGFDGYMEARETIEKVKSAKTSEDKIDLLTHAVEVLLTIASHDADERERHELNVRMGNVYE